MVGHIGCTHHLYQWDEEGRVPEVSAQNPLSVDGLGGDLRDAHGRCVGAQHRPRLARLIQARKIVLLELHVLQHALDGEVRLTGSLVKVQHNINALPDFVTPVGIHQAVFRQQLQVILNDPGGGLLLPDIKGQQLHGETGHRKLKRNAGSHFTGAEHGDLRLVFHIIHPFHQIRSNTAAPPCPPAMQKATSP